MLCVFRNGPLHAASGDRSNQGKPVLPIRMMLHLPPRRACQAVTTGSRMETPMRGYDFFIILGTQQNRSTSTMMGRFILALDSGTTSNRAILFTRDAGIAAVSQEEFAQIYPQPGWVEHDPAAIWENQLRVARDVLRKAGTDAGQVAAAGIANQRETTLLWNRETGKPVYNAIVWQDRRTAGICGEMKERGLEPSLTRKTGLLLDAYFSATKIRWILDHVEGARTLADAGKLAFGTVDSWLVWNFTCGKRHVTDVTNASRTLLFNIHTLQWDPDLLAMFDIPASLLPEVVPSSGIAGSITAPLLGGEIPIGGIAGDQQAALFGQMCTEEGMVKNTYGTGCFVMMNTGSRPVVSRHHLLTTMAAQVNGITSYALEGSIFSAGAVVQWLRDQLGIIATAADIGKLASTVADSGGVTLVPGFVGLGAPHWDPYATGAVFGLSRGSSKAHLARAALEAIALQSMEVIETMSADAGVGLRELRVDGGAALNNLLMQIQADLLGKTVVRPLINETTALGAACLAGLACGLWNDTAELNRLWQIDRVFSPAPHTRELDRIVGNWKKGVERSKQWYPRE